MAPLVQERQATRLRACLTSHWAPPLADLLPEFVPLPLSLADQAALFDAAFGVAPAPEISEALQADIDLALPALGGSGHLRLEPCSLKTLAGVPRIRSGAEAAMALSNPNGRVAQLLGWAESGVTDPALYLFAWHDIPAWAEFRLFVVEGRMMGITQYHCHRSYEEIRTRPRDIEAPLRKMGDALIKAAPLPRFSADVFLTEDLTARLIELNPLVRGLDCGLFPAQDFDGGFRYVAQSDAPAEDDDDIWRF